MLHAIWQADSGFPSGSFAFSGGLEGSTPLTALPHSACATAGGAAAATCCCARWASADRVAPCAAPTARRVERHHTGGALTDRGGRRGTGGGDPGRSPCAKARGATAWRCSPLTSASARPGRGPLRPPAETAAASGICAVMQGASVPRYRHGLCRPPSPPPAMAPRRRWSPPPCGLAASAPSRGSAPCRRVAAAGCNLRPIRRRRTPCRRLSPIARHRRRPPRPRRNAPVLRPETRRPCC